MAPVDCIVEIKKDGTSYTDTYGKDANEEILDDDLLIPTISRLRYWIETNAACGKPDLELLGRWLYRLIFHGDLKDRFESTVDAFLEHSDRQDRLRVILVFHRDAEWLQGLPWEFIFMPRGKHGFFLAGEKTALILTRLAELNAGEELQDEPEDAPLRVLVAVSKPAELGEIDAEEVVTSINELAGAEVRRIDNPRKQPFETAIADFKPHVLHFIGHGEEGKLALIREPDDIDDDDIHGRAHSEALWITSDTLRTMLSEVKPRLVFLHACKGAAGFVDSLSSFSNTARELVESAIPAVVGMQYEIENEDAALFAKTFYESVATGEPIDEAVGAGRRALGKHGSESWGDRRFGTPIVYLRTKEPIVLAKGTNGASTDQREEWFTCPYGTGCTAKADRSYKRCLDCRRALRSCPKCGAVMGAEPSMGCPRCDYVAESAQADVSQSASTPAAPAADVIRIRTSEGDVGVA